MRVRNVNQIGLSRETDSWFIQWHGAVPTGTVSGGTVSLSVPVADANAIQYVTGVSFASNVAGCRVDILNGTSYLYSMKLPAVDRFSQNFSVPLRSSKGTSININLYNTFGTAFLNLQGYTVK